MELRKISERMRKRYMREIWYYPEALSKGPGASQAERNDSGKRKTEEGERRGGKA